MTEATTVKLKKPATVFDTPALEFPTFEMPKMEIPAAFREFAEKERIAGRRTIGKR